MLRGRILTMLVCAVAVGVMMPARRSAPVATPALGATRGPAKPAPARFATLTRDGDGHFYADGEVNGEPVRFLVDTGATTVVLTRADAERLGVDFRADRFAAIGQGVAGPVMGQEVELAGVTVGGVTLNRVRAVVVADGLDVSLLGQSFLNRLAAVSISGGEMRLE